MLVADTLYALGRVTRFQPSFEGKLGVYAVVYELAQCVDQWFHTGVVTNFLYDDALFIVTEAIMFRFDLVIAK